MSSDRTEGPESTPVQGAAAESQGPRRPEDGVSLGVAYEVAKETLELLMGYAADRIRKEKAKPGPDQAEIDLWERRATEWAARRHTLRVQDVAAVRAVLDGDAAFYRSLPLS